MDNLVSIANAVKRIARSVTVIAERMAMMENRMGLFDKAAAEIDEEVGLRLQALENQVAKLSARAETEDVMKGLMDGQTH